MKKLLLLLLTIVSLQAKAQYVNIPDSNLRNELKRQFPFCFNSLDQLDTVTAAVTRFNPSTSFESFDLSFYNLSIKNTFGLQFFKKFLNIEFFSCIVDTFNYLPNSCRKLLFWGNNNRLLNYSIVRNDSLRMTNLTIYNLDSTINIQNLPPLLDTLSCFNIKANTLPNLPSNLTLLSCNNSGLSALPPLPVKLKYFYCSGNNIVTLPSLSNLLSLKGINCSFNKLVSLPSLPDSVNTIYANNNQLSSNTNFPSLLNVANFSNNKLVSIPTLGTRAYDLDFSNNLLSNFNCSSGIQLLNLKNNRLTSMPTNIPNYLFFLNCDSNNISGRVSIRKDWQVLSLSNNKITAISFFDLYGPDPSHKQEFNFSNNRISSIQNFAKNISTLDLSNNPIKFDSITPNNYYTFWQDKYFKHLNISNTLINDLSYISWGGGVENLIIDGNTFIDSPYFAIPIKSKKILARNCNFKYPIYLNRQYSGVDLECVDLSFSDFTRFYENSIGSNTIDTIKLIKNYNLTCMPRIGNLVKNIYVDSSIITCIPNFSLTSKFINTDLVDSFKYYSNDTSGFRLFFPQKCNPTNNKFNCFAYTKITGSVFIDENLNGVKDSSEQYKSNVEMSLSGNGGLTFTNSNGSFELTTNVISSKTINIKPPKYYSAIPNSRLVNILTTDTLIRVLPFALQKSIFIDSLAIKITPINWAARPGFPYTFLVQYENVGSNTVNANINLNYNTTALDYDSSSTSVTPTVGNLQLVRNSFTPGSQGAFVSYFKVKPSASLLGINLKSWASISGGTALASDTTNRVIGGSYDPNDKLATPQLTITQVAEGQFINYTIRFQNTGTDTAFTVVIADTLNSLLQANTFEMLGSSHNCKTIIQDNKIYFEFRNILLPDSTTNLIGSNGFVNFRIKPISSVALNTSIPNKAAIYFDYNEPIITNTASTLISNTILPLQLVRFNVLFRQGSGVLFNWETKNEQAVKEFVVEESKDAISFKALQQTKSKGNGDNNYFSNANYAATEMVGSKYYRLKTISNNGNIAYSQIVKLNFDKSIQPFIILQNPVKGSLQIQVNAQSLNNTEALLINQEGKMVQGFKLQLGSQTIGLNKLVAGMYTLKTVEGSKNLLVN